MKQASATFSLEVLTIVFVVLKLTNVIDWSWWWVLAPVWIPAAIFAVIAVVALLVYGAYLLFE